MANTAEHECIKFFVQHGTKITYNKKCSHVQFEVKLSTTV